MKFKLVINGDGVRTLSEETLLNALQNNLREDEDYIVLEPKIPIDYNIYIQVMFDASNNTYIIETRFLFEDNSYRHYSKVVTDLEDVKNLFLDYYQKCKLPVVSSWDSDELEDDICMHKLYKQEKGVTLYAEFWINEDASVSLHEGELGDVGETRVIEKIASPVIYIEQLQSEYKKKGYAPADDNMTEIVVQYQSRGDEDNEELLEMFEAELNNLLGWTGNGHCEGGDVVDNVISLFCQVIDQRIALGAIVDIFDENELLANLMISAPNDETEEYEILFPSR